MPGKRTRSGPSCSSWMVVKSATTVGRDVLVRVAHLVDELLLDDGMVMRPPVPGCFVTTNVPSGWPRRSDSRRSPGRESSASRPGSCRPRLARRIRSMWPAMVPAASGPSRRAPTELVDHSGQRERRCRCDRPVTTTFAPRAERFDDRPRAEVDVRALHAIADGRERLARVHVRELDAAREQIVEAVEDVVAGDDSRSCTPPASRASAPPRRRRRRTPSGSRRPRSR